MRRRAPGRPVAAPAVPDVRHPRAGLYRQAAAPEYEVRLKWRPNTIAFWDNRSTQHYAIQDYFPARRRMLRATIIGDMPV